MASVELENELQAVTKRALFDGGVMLPGWIEIPVVALPISAPNETVLEFENAATQISAKQLVPLIENV